MPSPLHLLRGAFSATTALTLLALPRSTADPERHLYPPDFWKDDTTFRRAIAQEFPGLHPCCYQFNGHFSFGIFSDDANRRILLVTNPDLPGRIVATLNGKRLRPESSTPVTILVANGDPSNPANISEFTLGHWIPLKTTDRFRLDGKITHPRFFKFYASYDPDRRWQSFLSKQAPSLSRT